MVNIATIVLSAFFGGLFFALLRNLVWRWYISPELRLDDSASMSFETDENGDIKYRVFRIPVENTGRTAAGNCKPELRMKGTLNGDLYEVSQQLTWAEGDNPQRITLNADENARFDLIRIKSEVPDRYLDEGLSLYVELPGNNQWGGDDSITVWEQEDGTKIGASIPDHINRSEFIDISWDEAKIIVTSDNAEKEEGDLSFQFGMENGLVGLGVVVE